MSDATCSRCKKPRPTGLLRGKGWVNSVLLRRTTVRHALRFNMWRITPWTEDPSDQVRHTYTDLELCSSCAADVFLYAQGREATR